MITCVETLSWSIFPVHKKTLRLSAAWWVVCLLLNMMTLRDQSGSCEAAGVGEVYAGSEDIPTWIYMTLLHFPFPRWCQRWTGKYWLAMTGREPVASSKTKTKQTKKQCRQVDDKNTEVRIAVVLIVRFKSLLRACFLVAGAPLASQGIAPNTSAGRIPLADEPLLISRQRRSDAVIWHSFCTQQEDKGAEEELMCQSEPVCCHGRWVHRSHKRAHRQDVVMVLGDSPGDRYTFCWVTA